MILFRIHYPFLFISTLSPKFKVSFFPSSPTNSTNDIPLVLPKQWTWSVKEIAKVPRFRTRYRIGGIFDNTSDGITSKMWLVKAKRARSSSFLGLSGLFWPLRGLSSGNPDPLALPRRAFCNSIWQFPFPAATWLEISTRNAFSQPSEEMMTLMS